MPDYAHEWTDKRIERLSKNIKREYRKAAKEMRAAAKERLAIYGESLASAKRALSSGELTKAEYERRLQLMAVTTARDAELASALTRMALTPRTTALNMIREEAPLVYAENANFATFLIEKAARLDTAFTLIDQSTVKVLLDKVPNLLPKPNTAKDTIWHAQKFTSAITQSVLTGESVQRAASRIASVMNMDAAAAVRSARTAMTAAENMGRQESYERAEQLGIKGVKVWMATLDERTRDSHREMDGKKVGIHDEFPNGLEEPGDPSGDPEEVYNCRCTMRFEVEGVEQEAVERFSRLPDGMTYDEWKHSSKGDIEIKPDENDSLYRYANNEDSQNTISEIITESNAVEEYSSAKEEYKEAVEYYASGEGMHINKILREQGMSGLYENEREAVKLLDKATKADNVDVPVLYRSVDASSVFGKMTQMQYEQLTEAYVYNDQYAMKQTQAIRDRIEDGKVIVEKGFMSTSEQYDVVADWYDFTGSDKPITLELAVPEGTKGCKVYELTPEVEAEDPQREVLLPRNTKYEVTGITSRDGLIYVKADIIND